MNGYYTEREEWVQEMFFDAWERYEDLRDDEDDDYKNHPSLDAAARNPSMLR